MIKELARNQDNMKLRIIIARDLKLIIYIHVDIYIYIYTYLEKRVPQSHLYSLVPQILE